MSRNARQRSNLCLPRHCEGSRRDRGIRPRNALLTPALPRKARREGVFGRAFSREAPGHRPPSRRGETGGSVRGEAAPARQTPTFARGETEKPLPLSPREEGGGLNRQLGGREGRSEGDNPARTRGVRFATF